MDNEEWRQVLSFIRARGLRLGFPHHGRQFHAWRVSASRAVPGIYYGDSICGKRIGQSLRDESANPEWAEMCRACKALCTA